jgi:hypothetical protein
VDLGGRGVQRIRHSLKGPRPIARNRPNDRNDSLARVTRNRMRASDGTAVEGEKQRCAPRIAV